MEEKIEEKILVLDFGGQYNQLIARRVRENSVYAEIKPYNKITPEEIKAKNYKGIIFTGGPNSVYDMSSPHYDKAVFDLGIPVLGICYGVQLMAFMLGGEVRAADNGSEYGRTETTLHTSPLFSDIPEHIITFMSHTDYISRMPDNFVSIAHTDKCPTAAICDEKNNLYGVQFHPEVTHTEYGKTIIKNFLFNVCKCRGLWTMDDFVKKSVDYYKRTLENKKVLLALSGGVDSSVAAVLLHKAIGDRLVCVFVDHGLLRLDEGDFVEKTFKGMFGINLIRLNCEDYFLSKLSGTTEPEAKRKIIGESFIRVFEQEAKKIGHVNALVQGTIYPDVIESGLRDSATIKSHHNVGGLPDVIAFDEIIEPLRELFKDEVREVGEKLGIPHELVWRQPFPGPGLAVRIIGEITKEKLEILKLADAIFREEIANFKLEKMTNQYFAVLTATRSVGVMGDARTYGYTIALRAVTTDDFMTAEWTRLPYELLSKASNRITNEVGGISRVVYDITSKPPATVEWE